MCESSKHIIKLLKQSNVFLSGGAGTGKTYTTLEIIRYYKLNNKQILVTASTGIAAVKIGGQTLHSLLRLGIMSTFHEFLEQKLNSKLKKDLRQIISKADLLIIDEISILNAAVINMIAHRLKQFGFLGRLLVVGDFFQLPPVRLPKLENELMLKYFIEEDQKEANFGYAFSAKSWDEFDFYTVILTANQRSQDNKFNKITNLVRHGSCTDEVQEFLMSLINKKKFYDPLNTTLLFATNYEVKNFNEKLLKQNNNTLFEISYQKRIKVDSIEVKQEASFVKSLPIEEILRLKIGVPVLFTINTEDFKNGESGIIKDINISTDDESPYSIIVSKANGDEVLVKKHEFELKAFQISQDKEGVEIIKEKVIAIISQFPLKLSWSITIHKSQGMSIDKLAIAIDNIFEKSQFYVALSRSTNSEGLCLYSKLPKMQVQNFFKSIISADSKVIDFYDKVKDANKLENRLNLI